LHVRNYRVFFFSQLVSVSGTSMQGIGQAWLILKLHGGGLALGGVTAAQFLPILVFGPYGGLIADRHDRRRLVLGTQVVGAVLALLLGVLTATGDIRMWMVFAIAFVLGCAGAVDAPARQVFATDMVPPALVTNAVSLNEVVMNASRVFGPAAGALVIVRYGVSVCFFVNAATFIAPIVALLLVRPADMHRSATAHPGPGQIREGLRYAWSAPLLRSLVLMAAAAAMVFNFAVALPLLAESVLHAGAGGYGAMVAAFGVGALAGAFLAASDRAPNVRRVQLLAVLTGVAVVTAAAMPTLGAELAAMALTGLFSIWFISLANAVLQLRTRPALRGRLMGLWAMALPGTLPITGPIVGWIADGLGPREALGAGGVAVLITTALGWRALAADPREPDPPVWSASGRFGDVANDAVEPGDEHRGAGRQISHRR
jgi:MFS family permease